MAQREKEKRARRKPAAGERVMLGLRVTPEVKQRLDTAAEQKGRSQSQEAELRIERSFDREDLLSEVLSLAYGKEVAGILMLLGIALQETGYTADALAGSKRDPEEAARRSRHAWLDDPFAYDQAIRAATRILEAGRPPGNPKPPAGSVAAVTAIQDLEWWSTSANLLLLALKGRFHSSHISKPDAEKIGTLLGRIAERMKKEAHS